jgi:hypothetical protein
MAGIALVQLNWLLELGEPDRRRGRLPADGDFQAAVSQERGRFAVVRRGATWFAVKRTRTRDRLHWGDLRYDGGLVMALRKVGRRWKELVPQRPLTTGKRNASAGPVLLRRRGAFFQGHHMVVGRSGRVVIRGAYRTGGGHSVRRATLSYRPTHCGVTMGFDARPSNAFELSAFFIGRPRVGRRSATDGRQRVAVGGGRVRMRLVPGTLASGTQPRLYRVAIVVRARRAGMLRLAFCRA